MSTPFFLALVVLGCAPIAMAQDGSEAEPIALVVFDRSGLFDGEPTEPAFIAGNFNGWDPQGRASARTFAPDGETPGGWVFELGRPGGVGLDHLEFKVTRGSWATVEVDAEGRDIANRTWSRDVERNDESDLDGSITVMGFADQHREGERASTVVGELETFRFASEALGNERTVRVWLPPGYRDEANAERRYPVLYLHDGQNCFDRATSAFGMEWEVDETLTRLIEAGRVPPTIVVGIDNAGAMRSAEYNSPVVEARGLRGIGDRYVRMLTDELLPEINRQYRTKTGPEHTSIGGSSFGGNISLLAMMLAPETFGRALVESPASATSYIGDAFREQIEAYEGPWASRVFVAMGDAETGNAARDAELVADARRLVAVLREGTGVDEVKLVIGEGDAHNEQAWARRLEGALVFLFGEE